MSKTQAPYPWHPQGYIVKCQVRQIRMTCQQDTEPACKSNNILQPLLFPGWHDASAFHLRCPSEFWAGERTGRWDPANLLLAGRVELVRKIRRSGALQYLLPLWFSFLCTIIPRSCLTGAPAKSSRSVPAAAWSTVNDESPDVPPNNRLKRKLEWCLTEELGLLQLTSLSGYWADSFLSCFWLPSITLLSVHLIVQGWEGGRAHGTTVSAPSEMGDIIHPLCRTPVHSGSKTLPWSPWHHPPVNLSIRVVTSCTVSQFLETQMSNRVFYWLYQYYYRSGITPEKIPVFITIYQV